MQIRRRLVCVYGWHLILIGSLFPEITFLNSPDCHSCAWCCVKGMKATGREHPSLQTRLLCTTHHSVSFWMSFLFQALVLTTKRNRSAEGNALAYICNLLTSKMIELKLLIVGMLTQTQFTTFLLPKLSGNTVFCSCIPLSLSRSSPYPFQCLTSQIRFHIHQCSTFLLSFSFCMPLT